jgi:hypothetical protein
VSFPFESKNKGRIVLIGNDVNVNRAGSPTFPNGAGPEDKLIDPPFLANILTKRIERPFINADDQGEVWRMGRFLLVLSRCDETGQQDRHSN